MIFIYNYKMQAWLVLCFGQDNHPDGFSCVKGGKVTPLTRERLCGFVYGNHVIGYASRIPTWRHDSLVSCLAAIPQVSAVVHNDCCKIQIKYAGVLEPGQGMLMPTMKSLRFDAIHACYP